MEQNENKFPIFSIIFIIMLIVIIFRSFSFDTTKLKHVDMEPFSEPIQEKIINGKPFQHKVKDGVAIITPIADYKIYGRVYARHYRPYKLYWASMYPYDISIGFGDFQYKEVYRAIKVRMAATVSYPSCSYSKWKKINSKYFQQKSFEHCFTNNHLCPANSRVKQGLAKLRKKDIVYIEGYLIKFELQRKDGRHEEGISSTSRNDEESIVAGDNGFGSCEQIYVTRLVSRHGDFR